MARQLFAFSFHQEGLPLLLSLLSSFIRSLNDVVAASNVEKGTDLWSLSAVRSVVEGYM